MENLKLIGACILLIGALFILLGSIGLLRMPDFFNRVQTGTKASTMGVALSLVGLAFIQPDWIGKLSILIVFVLITNPLSSHVLGRAAHGNGVKLSSSTKFDALQEDKLKNIEPSKSETI